VADYGDARLDNVADGVGHPAATFELDRVGAGFLHEASGVLDGPLYRDVVGHEGHIPDQHSPLQAALDRAGVVEQLVHGDGDGVGIAQHDVGRAVAHQYRVDARRVDDTGGGGVVGGDHGDG